MRELATITSTQLASELGVSDRTVRLWIQNGTIQADARTAGKHARFKPSTVRRLLQWLKRMAA